MVSSDIEPILSRYTQLVTPVGTRDAGPPADGNQRCRLQLLARMCQETGRDLCLVIDVQPKSRFPLRDQLLRGAVDGTARRDRDTQLCREQRVAGIEESDIQIVPPPQPAESARPAPGKELRADK